VGFFELPEFVSDQSDGSCVGGLGSLEFVQSIGEVADAFLSFGFGGLSCLLAVCFNAVFNVIPLVGGFEGGV